jgi:hypothetical protein
VPHAGTSITNILLSPNSQRLRAELIRVLARYPQAQAEVTAVFRQAGLRAATEIGGSAEKMIEGLPVVRSSGSPRPWPRAADNHGYRRLDDLAVGARPAISFAMAAGGLAQCDRRRGAEPGVGPGSKRHIRSGRRTCDAQFRTLDGGHA